MTKGWDDERLRGYPTLHTPPLHPRSSELQAPSIVWYHRIIVSEPHPRIAGCCDIVVDYTSSSVQRTYSVRRTAALYHKTAVVLRDYVKCLLTDEYIWSEYRETIGCTYGVRVRTGRLWRRVNVRKASCRDIKSRSEGTADGAVMLLLPATLLHHLLFTAQLLC